MGLLQTMRRVLAMSANRPTAAELAEREAACHAELRGAEFELADLKTEAAEASLAATLDDTTVAKIDKKIAAKRGDIVQLKGRLRRFRLARKAREEEDGRQKYVAEVKAVDELLASAGADFEQLDAWAQSGGALHRRLFGTLEAIDEQLAKLPLRVRHKPAVLTWNARRAIFLRLYAFGGETVHGKAGIDVHEAQKLPTLAEQAAAARAELMAQLEPRAADVLGPEAA